MFRLGCCIEMMFTEYPFAERIRRAAEAGFAGVEFWGWAEKDLFWLRDEADKAGIPVTDCLVDTADAGRAEQFAKYGMLSKENARLYAEMVEESICAVKPLGASMLISTTGNALGGVDRQAQRDAAVECLKAAVPVLEKEGFTLLLEPLNELDHCGYFLNESREAAEILKEVNSPRVKMLYDIYHQQVTEGDLIRTIRQNIGLIGHFHLADVPGRHEPGTGEINYANVLSAIAATDYAGFVGCEYSPSEGRTTLESARELLLFASEGPR